MIIKFERSKKRKTKGKMARRLVYYCIAVLTETAIWAQVVTTLAGVKGWEVDLSGYLSTVLVFVGGAFGFELLALLLKRVFAKPTDDTEMEE